MTVAIAAGRADDNEVNATAKLSELQAGQVVRFTPAGKGRRVTVRVERVERLSLPEWSIVHGLRVAAGGGIDSQSRMNGWQVPHRRRRRDDRRGSYGCVVSAVAWSPGAPSARSCTEVTLTALGVPRRAPRTGAAVHGSPDARRVHVPQRRPRSALPYGR